MDHDDERKRNVDGLIKNRYGIRKQLFKKNENYFQADLEAVPDDILLKIIHEKLDASAVASSSK